MRKVSCVLGAIACLISARADADVSKAWAAAKDNLPSNTQFIVAIDVAAIYKTALFPKALEAFKGMDRDIGEAHALIKRSCGWDPVSVIDGIVIAGDPSGRGEGIAFLQLKIDRTKASACLLSTLKALKKGGVTVKQDGAYTVASKGRGRDDSAYFPWVGSNVVAISIRPDKKSKVDAWFNQKGFGRSRLGGMLGKLDPKAVVAGAFAADKPIDSWVPVTAAYGNWTIGGGKLTGTLVATATDAKAAKSLADELNQEIQRDSRRDRTPPSVKKIMQSLTISATGKELTIKGWATQKDLGDALGESFRKKKQQGSSLDDATANALVAKMDDFSKQMCRCKDKACADKVNEALTTWGTNLAKDPALKSSKPSPDLAKKSADIMTRYTECMTKLMMQNSNKKN